MLGPLMAATVLSSLLLARETLFTAVLGLAYAGTWPSFHYRLLRA